jgi:uncharacterized SAM-binding protein YcdF (DUF218 family)
MAAMQNKLRLQRIAAGFVRGLVLTMTSMLALLLLVCVLIVVQGRRDETRTSSAAIVLGAAQWNGEPSPVLRARLDHALDLYRRGTVRRVILTGGVGEGDTVSEAAAGREYLIEQGVSAEALLLEEQGRTTWESLNNAAALTRENGLETVLLVSDSYHMLRSLKMAHDLKLNAAASPISLMDLEITLDAVVHVLREAAAYLVYIFTRQ